MSIKVVAGSPIINPPFNDLPEVNFTKGFDPSQLRDGWGKGGYNEKREKMYIAPQYKNERNIHMGLDIWAPAGEAVYAAFDGIVAYSANHDEDGNYGFTVVLEHIISGKKLYALYGHLSFNSLEKSKPGNLIRSGDVIGWLGDRSENGNWHPHLHYQLSWEDPETADMPGVVSEEVREAALQVYPNPETVLGRLL